MSGIMNDPKNYQQPEDDSLEFWMWCEEQSALHAEDDDESIELELVDDLWIEILPDEPPF